MLNDTRGPHTPGDSLSPDVWLHDTPGTASLPSPESQVSTLCVPTTDTAASPPPQPHWAALQMRKQRHEGVTPLPASGDDCGPGPADLDLLVTATTMCGPWSPGPLPRPPTSLSKPRMSHRPGPAQEVTPAWPRVPFCSEGTRRGLQVPWPGFTLTYGRCVGLGSGALQEMATGPCHFRHHQAVCVLARGQEVLPARPPATNRHLASPPTTPWSSLGPGGRYQHTQELRSPAVSDTAPA